MLDWISLRLFVQLWQFSFSIAISDTGPLLSTRLTYGNVFCCFLPCPYPLSLPRRPFPHFLCAKHWLANCRQRLGRTTLFRHGGKKEKKREKRNECHTLLPAQCHTLLSVCTLSYPAVCTMSYPAVCLHNVTPECQTLKGTPLFG